MLFIDLSHFLLHVMSADEGLCWPTNCECQRCLIKTYPHLVL